VQAHLFPGQDTRVATLLVTNAELRERTERLTAALRACVLELEWFAPGRPATVQGRAALADDESTRSPLAALTGLPALPGLLVTELTPETITVGGLL
jgi:hypothetical protein